MFLQLRVQIIIKFCFHGAGGLISSIVLRGDHPTGIGHPHPPNPMYSPLFTKPFFSSSSFPIFKQHSTLSHFLFDMEYVQNLTAFKATYQDLPKQTF